MKFKSACKEIQKICSYKEKEDCEHLFCILHEPEYLGDLHKGNHVCLGCSLNDSISKIDRFLSETSNLDDMDAENIEYIFTIYILLMYLAVEKLHTIFKFIGITWDYVEENWKVLVEIRKWANFIKHPKGFLFTHHPTYIFETDRYNKTDKKSKYLTYEDFISKLYFREDEKKFKATIAEVANKDNVVVVLPCPERLTREFVEVCREFCEKIKNNEHFKEVLKNHVIKDIE